MTAEYSSKFRYAPDLFVTRSTGTFTLKMDGPPNPTTMSVQEREENGIVTVSKNQLMTLGPKLNISETMLETMMNMDQDVFYFTASAPTCEITEPEPDEFMSVSDSPWNNGIESDPNEPYVTGFSWGSLSKHIAHESYPSTTDSVDIRLNDDKGKDGIVKITKEQLKSNGPRAGLSDSTIEALIGMDQDVFYFTASAPTCRIVQNNSSVVRGHVYETGFSWSEIT